MEIGKNDGEPYKQHEQIKEFENFLKTDSEALRSL